MSQVVSVDFGGTNIRIAYFPSPEPPPSIQSKSPTEAEKGPDHVISRLIAAIEAALPADTDDLRIGVGAPGPLDPRRGIVLEAPNLPGWIDFPLRDRLKDHFQFPVAIGNDANLAALGEWRHGAGKQVENLIYLTVSTGIGGGVIADGRMLLGAQGLAAELGHVTIDRDGQTCGCGLKGHIEAIAAGPAIARTAKRRIEKGEESSLTELLAKNNSLTTQQVGEAAIEGDSLAGQVVAEAGTIIGHYLADLAHVFNPEIIVIGGGVSLIGSPLFDPIQRSFEAHVMHPAYAKDLEIVPASLGDDAGLIGAMVLTTLE